jgi:hypothetical protein
MTELYEPPYEEISQRRTEHERFMPRVEQGLSPSDDDLGLATAVRLKDEMAQACEAFAAHRRKK